MLEDCGGGDVASFWTLPTGGFAKVGGIGEGGAEGFSSSMADLLVMPLQTVSVTREAKFVLRVVSDVSVSSLSA